MWSKLIDIKTIRLFFRDGRTFDLCSDSDVFSLFRDFTREDRVEEKTKILTLREMCNENSNSFTNKFDIAA